MHSSRVNDPSQKILYLRSLPLPKECGIVNLVQERVVGKLPKGGEALFMVEPYDYHALSGHVALIRDVNGDGWIDRKDALASRDEILAKLKELKEIKGSDFLSLGKYLPNFFTLNVHRSFVVNPLVNRTVPPAPADLLSPKNGIPPSAITLLDFSPLPQKEFFWIHTEDLGERVAGKEQCLTRRFTVDRFFMEGKQPKVCLTVSQP